MGERFRSGDHRYNDTTRRGSTEARLPRHEKTLADILTLRSSDTASPPNSVLPIDVDANANYATMIAIVTIVFVLAVVAIPLSVVATATVLHDDLLEEVADERVPVGHWRPVLDESQRAGERSAAA